MVPRDDEHAEGLAPCRHRLDVGEHFAEGSVALRAAGHFGGHAHRMVQLSQHARLCLLRGAQAGQFGAQRGDLGPDGGELRTRLRQLGAQRRELAAGGSEFGSAGISCTRRFGLPCGGGQRKFCLLYTSPSPRDS